MLCNRGDILQFCLSNTEYLSDEEIPWTFCVADNPARYASSGQTVHGIGRDFHRFNTVLAKKPITPLRLNGGDYEVMYPNRPTDHIVGWNDD